jgi:hypothetical protein
MKTDLERDEFLVLLEKLRSEDDSIILATVGDINSKMMVAEVSWDDLLISQDDIQVDNDVDAEVQDANNANNAKNDNDSDGTIEPLNDEEKREAEDLIGAIRSMKVSGSTKKELDEYASDIKEGEFELMDLRYLRALKARLSV